MHIWALHLLIHQIQLNYNRYGRYLYWNWQHAFDRIQKSFKKNTKATRVVNVLYCLRVSIQNLDIQIHDKRLWWDIGICWRYTNVCIIANKALVKLETAAPNQSANNYLDRNFQRESHFDVNHWVHLLK